MSQSKGWDFEANSQEKAGELQLQAYGEFLNEYGIQIRRIELNLEDFINTSWNFHVDPITLTLEPYENTTILELISTDNKVLKKVLAVFTTLSEEVNFLQKEANEKFFNSLLFYGEAESTSQDGNIQMNISTILPLLQELTTFIKRCQQVASQIILQLNALYSTSSEGTLRKVINASDIHLYEIFENLGELILILIILEEIIKNHHILQENWITFKQTIKTIHHDTVKFEIEAKKLKLFEKKIMNIETILFSGKIFMSSINQIINQKVGLNKNTILADEFNLYLKNALINLENKLNEQINCDITHFWVKISGIFIVNSSLFGTSDKKIFKQIWDLHKKIPAVNLIGNILWFPENFFNTNMPQLLKMIDKKSQSTLLSSRKNYLKIKSQMLQKDVNQYTMQAFLWMIQLESSLQKDSTQLKFDILNTRCNLILQSANLASSIKYSIKTILNLYVALSMPMTKSVALAICRLIEILKSIYLMFSCHILSIAESINHVKQFLIFQALNIISKAKKGLIKDKHYSAKSLDILSALVLAEICLNGSGTRQRRLITILSISIANQMKTFKEDDLIQLFTIIKKLDVICEIQSKLSISCNCSFLYWHRVIIPIYFTDLYESHTDVHRLMYMFCAFYDSLQVIIQSKHSISPMKLKGSFENEILEYLKVCIIKPICHKVETNLRLYAHSHLQMNEKNAYHLEIEDYLPIIKLKPIKLGDNYINIKSYLEHYLDETFYNLITVALHDWRTYGEMRGLAKYKYDLITVEDHLPSQTLEQGLDVLEIMRNIHIFVSKYLYNLNNQIFIEQSSNNKHLNTINIQHIANSIRTHGTGIMNTTVNFTYQFLRKKFFVFSQFMYDEHIKSRLSKDLRYFRENKEKLEQKYPSERANKFNKGIRNLGLNSEGQSYLDQFRILITHIGNAMGYIRMIRSGGLHCCSNAICFIPDLDDIVNFEELCKEENLSKSCIEAAQTLDQIIQNLIRNFAEGTEYFKLLVDVFSPVFRDKKNIHLRNFYVIVPALTINFVEYSTTCKEKLSKKNKIGAAFTDDGFAMGIAYILKLLDQYNEFDSLHWFQSIREKYMKEKQNLQKQKDNSSKDDEKLQQTMTLTERRLDIFQQEFDLLYYNLSSARIFFQKDQSPPRIEQNKSESSL